MTLQIIWIVFCLSVVVGVGVHNYSKARENDRSLWKPEKKVSTIDYAAGVATLQYEMPYVKIRLEILKNLSSGAYDYEDYDDDYDYADYSDYENSYDYDYDLDNLNYFDVNFSGFSVYRFYERAPGGLNSEYVDVNVEVVDKTVADYGTYYRAMFEFIISFDDAAYPDPLRYEFTTDIGFDPRQWSLEGDVYMYVNIGRSKEWKDDISNFKSRECAKLKIADYNEFVIQYSESVLKKLDGSTESDISLSLHDTTRDNWHGKYMAVILDGDPLVEHWEQYMEYDYIDWFVGMGGLVSFAITAFFFVADKIPIALSEKSTGILSKFSLLYKLKEIVMDLGAQEARSSEYRL